MQMLNIDPEVAMKARLVSDTNAKIAEIAKPCPNCKILIHKYDGCNHVKCGKCSMDFCWLCLKEWTFSCRQHWFAGAL